MGLPFYLVVIHINKREKEYFQYAFDAEEDVLHELAKQYKVALDDINEKIMILQSNELTQSKIYQLQYQQALKGQVEGILEKLHSDEYSTIQKFLEDSYTNGFVGTMYSIHGQGIPLMMPIDQKAAVKAIITDSKISKSLYDALGVDTSNLKKAIRQEITRGIASQMSNAEIARNISNVTKAPLSRAKTIVRTENHRIQQSAAYDAQKASKAMGADVVKQWDSTLDGRTRPTHRQLDGQIQEIDKPFKEGGMEAMFPGDFGDPAEDCNCRCVSLTRAKWALDDDELQTLKDRAKFFGLDKTNNFEDFKVKYLETSQKPLEILTESGKMKLGNTEVRKWYIDSVSKIPSRIDKSLPIEEQAHQAFEARNNIRTEARMLMADEETRKMLDERFPNPSFEALVKSKMNRKGMTREEAIQDIYDTAIKTNENVNRELGLDGE